MKKPFVYLILGLGLLCINPPTGIAQKKPATDEKEETKKDSTDKKETKKKAPKSFQEFIKNPADADKGLFTIYSQEDNFYFEIPDSLMGRDIIVVNRISRSGVDLRAGFSGYAGDQINENVIRYEKGPNNKVFLKKISF